jgi:hypothetical protein
MSTKSGSRSTQKLSKAIATAVKAIKPPQIK